MYIIYNIVIHVRFHIQYIEVLRMKLFVLVHHCLENNFSDKLVWKHTIVKPIGGPSTVIRMNLEKNKEGQAPIMPPFYVYKRMCMSIDVIMYTKRECSAIFLLQTFFVNTRNNRERALFTHYDYSSSIWTHTYNRCNTHGRNRLHLPTVVGCMSLTTDALKLSWLICNYIYIYTFSDLEHILSRV